jgi:hypothetical protein
MHHHFYFFLRYGTTACGVQGFLFLSLRGQALGMRVELTAFGETSCRIWEHIVVLFFKETAAWPFYFYISRHPSLGVTFGHGCSLSLNRALIPQKHISSEVSF